MLPNTITGNTVSQPNFTQLGQVVQGTNINQTHHLQTADQYNMRKSK